MKEYKVRAGGAGSPARRQGVVADGLISAESIQTFRLPRMLSRPAYCRNPNNAPNVSVLMGYRRICWNTAIE